MATATKPSAPVPPSPAREGEPAGALRRALDATYRFCASVKLAVVSLLTLSAVLAYGTFYESRHGTSAVQEEIYKSTPFALLLAVLGINIFCAASIRYPWKKRQTGFVVTHVGLLILLAGSFISKQWSEEGQVGYLEGEDHDVVMAQPDSAILRLKRLDPETGKPIEGKEYEIPFRPGPFAWGPGRVEDLSREGEPFKVVVKGFLPASTRKTLHEPATPGTAGVPMLKLDAHARPPGSPTPFDVFAMNEQDPGGRLRWFVAANEFGRVGRQVGPARFVFQYAETPDLVDDFLHPPADPNTRLARLHYTDLKGAERVFDWVVDGRPRTEVLPDSDLTVKFVKTSTYPDPDHSFARYTGDSSFPVVQFSAHKGADGPELAQVGFSTLPAMSSFLAKLVRRALVWAAAPGYRGRRDFCSRGGGTTRCPPAYGRAPVGCRRGRNRGAGRHRRGAGAGARRGGPVRPGRRRGRQRHGLSHGYRRAGARQAAPGGRHGGGAAGPAGPGRGPRGPAGRRRGGPRGRRGPDPG